MSPNPIAMMAVLEGKVDVEKCVEQVTTTGGTLGALLWLQDNRLLYLDRWKIIDGSRQMNLEISSKVDIRINNVVVFPANKKTKETIRVTNSCLSQFFYRQSMGKA